MKRNFLTSTIIITLSIVAISNPAVEQWQTDTTCHSHKNRLPDTNLMSDGLDINKYLIPEDQPTPQMMVVNEMQKSSKKSNAACPQKGVRSEIRTTTPAIINNNRYYLSKELITIFLALNKEEPDPHCSFETADPNYNPTLFGSYYPGLLNEKYL